MGFDEFLDKSRKVVDDGTKKVHDARHSEKAGKFRHGVVDGFEKVMKAILPGESKNTPMIGSAQQHVDEAIQAARDTVAEAKE